MRTPLKMSLLMRSFETWNAVSGCGAVIVSSPNVTATSAGSRPPLARHSRYSKLDQTVGPGGTSIGAPLTGIGGRTIGGETTVPGGSTSVPKSPGIGTDIGKGSGDGVGGTVGSLWRVGVAGCGPPIRTA